LYGIKVGITFASALKVRRIAERGKELISRFKKALKKNFQKNSLKNLE
jgi:ribosomal protein S17E